MLLCILPVLPMLPALCCPCCVLPMLPALCCPCCAAQAARAVRTRDGLDACRKVVAVKELVHLVVALILRALPHLRQWQQRRRGQRQQAEAAAVSTRVSTRGGLADWRRICLPLAPHSPAPTN